MALNFSAGPSRVPREVLYRAAAEITDYMGHEASFMELSHRDPGGPVQNLLVETQSRIRRLLSVPPDYHILFVQGGAHAQFSAVPINLLGQGGVAGFVDTGQWSVKSMNEAERTHATKTVAFSRRRFPPVEEWKIDDVDYVHVCANETMTGIEMLSDPVAPKTADGRQVVLVGDFTSTLMSRPIDVTRYGAIYASSGKNLGPPGYAVVIVRDDLLDRAPANSPGCLLWREQARSTPIQNIYNTPPTYTVYLSSLVLEKLERDGGVEQAEKRAIERARVIYDAIDGSNGFYETDVEKQNRSRMNVPFRIKNRSLESEFLAAATEAGMTQLAGHPATGGLRATI